MPQKKILNLRAQILRNQNIKAAYWHCLLKAPGIAKTAQPGQFINIKVCDGLDPLLRRPLSIHRVNGSTIEVLYEVVGKGTAILSQRKPGEILDIIGPLGNGFSYQTEKKRRLNAILVGGGMGVAPLFFLAQQLKANRPLVLIGARTKELISCEKEFKSLGCRVFLATDNGSAGFKGKVTDLLKNVLLKAPDAKLTVIYACGPQPMLKAISSFIKVRGLSAQLSLEEHMSCGIGACLGCVVKTRSGFKRVCKEGPVFNAQDLVWD